MSRRSWTVCAMLAATAASFPVRAADAQPGAGTIEIGAFGQRSAFDANAGRPNVVPEDGWGYGARLGFFFTPRLQLEADGYLSPQDRDADETFCCTGARPTEVDVSAVALRLNYNAPLASLMQLVLGLGAVRTSYAFGGGTGPESSTSGFGVSGLAGLRVGIMGPLAVRVDGVADYMPGHEPDPNLNLHARAGLSLLLGGRRAPVAAPAPPPAVYAPMVPPPSPPSPPAPTAETINVCVVENGSLRGVPAQYASATGDTTVAGRAFAQAYPATEPPYAAGAAWFIQGDGITVDGRRYVKYGLPRVLGMHEVTRSAEHQGVPVFTEGGAARADVVYVPVRPGCEFQPYQTEVKSRSVRGE